ncbi:MAG: hypothetical protein P4L59_19710 [Desulfosporosinus sp.]|nr:hypothetical protein [Desulfosporosinus sp.]
METNHIMEDATRRIKKEAFLTAFQECGMVTLAAEIAGIARSTHYRWLEEDPAYPALFVAATEQASERLEQEARRRAVEGTKKDVYYQGKPCGVVTEYSDTLLIFLMKGAMPDKYKDRISNELNVVQPSTPGGVNTLKQLKEAEAIATAVNGSKGFS